MENFEVIVIRITRDIDGLYMAVSPHLAGVCIVHRDKDQIIEDMPDVVKLWYRSNRGIEVEPFWGTSRETDGASAVPMFTVRAEIAAQALAR